MKRTHWSRLGAVAVLLALTCGWPNNGPRSDTTPAAGVPGRLENADCAVLTIENAARARQVGIFEAPASSARGVAFPPAAGDTVRSPDGHYLAVAAADPALVLLDARTGLPVRRLAGHAKAPRRLAFSPDGTLLASAGDDLTLRLWDVQTGAALKIFILGREVDAVTFSPDGRLLAFDVQGEGLGVVAVCES